MSNTNIEINIDEAKWLSELPEVEKIISKACLATLVESGILAHAKYLDVSMLLANDVKIQELNGDYRNKGQPTNVLSFPQEILTAGDYEDVDVSISLGDIVLSLETIQKEAAEQKKTFEHHLVHLVVHGTLHLLGYDHEEAGDAHIMESLEVEILDEMGINNPY